VAEEVRAECQDPQPILTRYARAGGHSCQSWCRSAESEDPWIPSFAGSAKMDVSTLQGRDKVAQGNALGRNNTFV
jgi:hypothetical protein